MSDDNVSNDTDHEPAWHAGPFTAPDGREVDRAEWLQWLPKSGYGPHHVKVVDVITRVAHLAVRQREGIHQAIWETPGSGAWHYKMSEAGWRAMDAAVNSHREEALEAARSVATQASDGDEGTWLAAGCAVTAVLCRDLISSEDFSTLTYPLQCVGIRFD